MPVTAPSPDFVAQAPQAPNAVTRAMVSRALADVDWPARPADLVHQARQGGTRAGVIQALSALPNGIYAGPNQVCRVLFGASTPTRRTP